MRIPKISVLMPNYNCERYIRKAIESILEQTYEDFELIIVDDCSTDGSWQIIQEYVKKDSRVRAYKNEKNQGIPKTRNRAVSLANGEYLAQMDSDDISFKDRFEKQMALFLENDVVGSDIVLIDQNDRKVGTREYCFNSIGRVILKESPLANPTTIFKRELIDKYGNYDENCSFGEDYDLWLRFYSKGAKFSGVSEVLYYYRQHSGQSKYTRTKETLRKTIYVKLKSKKKYGLKFGVGDWCRLICEFVLLALVPKRLILLLFYLQNNSKKRVESND